MIFNDKALIIDLKTIDIVKFIINSLVPVNAYYASVLFSLLPLCIPNLTRNISDNVVITFLRRHLITYHIGLRDRQEVMLAIPIHVLSIEVDFPSKFMKDTILIYIPVHWRIYRKYYELRHAVILP